MDEALSQQLHEAMQALQNNDAEQALLLIDRVAAAADRRGDAEAELAAVGLLAPTLANLGRKAEAKQIAERAIALAKQVDDPEGVAHYESFVVELDDPSKALDIGDDQAIDAIFDVAGAALDRGDGRAAVKALTPVVLGATAANRGDVEASARGMIAHGLMMMGRSDRALKHAERALVLAQSDGDPMATAHFSQLVGDLAQSAKTERAVKHALLAGHVHAAMVLAEELIEAGDTDEALQRLYPLVQEAKDLEARESEATLRGLIAQTLLLTGKRDEAKRHAERALEVARGLGDEEAAAGFQELVNLAIGIITPIAEA